MNPKNLFARQASVQQTDLTVNRTQLHDILTRADLQSRDGHVLTQLTGEMASAKLIHRFESKLESQFEAQNAKLDAQTNKLKLLLWFTGLGVALIIAIGGILVSTLLN